MSRMIQYVVYFAQEHVSFRYSEISSLLKLWNIPCNLPQSICDPIQKPFCIIELPNEESARKLASRSVSIRCIFELWSYSTQLTHFHDTLRAYLKERETDKHFMAMFDKDRSFKVTVETYNKHLKQNEKIKKIETMDYLPVKGNANLKNPDVEWYYIEYYGPDVTIAPDQPYDILFGRWITDGNRDMINDISLKTRKFIGNTSMDSQLSLLMANQVMAKRGDLVFDPFVGTGSLLVASAKYGAYVAGTDIDFLMLHGRTRPTRINQKVREEDESVYANLKQYKCQNLYLDVLVSDFSLPIWTENVFFDGIVTDPPYGIREALEKIQFKDRPNTKSDESNENVAHYPSTSTYDLSQLYRDLLIFSAKYLKLGGRLVCWVPIYKSDYNEKSLPQHSCLNLIANSEQELSKLTSRRLLTYEKIADPVDDASVNSNDIEEMDDFRTKFFSYREETRQERRVRRAELRENGRIEALKRGKQLDENGKIINPKKDA